MKGDEWRGRPQLDHCLALSEPIFAMLSLRTFRFASRSSPVIFSVEVGCFGFAWYSCSGAGGAAALPSKVVTRPVSDTWTRVPEGVSESKSH